MDAKQCPECWNTTFICIESIKTPLNLAKGTLARPYAWVEYKCDECSWLATGEHLSAILRILAARRNVT